MRLTLAFVLSLYVCRVFSDNWALLVSTIWRYEWYNFEADVCNAYHVLRNNGFPEDRIIVMMSDDIVNNSRNPFPGTIINRPDGPNVYKGVTIDYRDIDVDHRTFINVLTGNEEKMYSPGKVIKSGPNDNIFVYIAYNGAPYVIPFPLRDSLYAEHLNEILWTMHKQKKYKEIVFYLEGNESGSIFDGILNPDLNVFAVTATNPNQLQFPLFYDSDRHCFLGDVFSAAWMEDSERSDVTQESLSTQYRRVKAKTNTSDVMKYGDMSMESRKVGYFQGNLTNAITTEYDGASDSSLYFRPESERLQSMYPSRNTILTDDVQLEILKRKTSAANGKDRLKYEASIRQLMKKKRDVRNYFKTVVQSVTDISYEEVHTRPLNSTDLTCYRQGIERILAACPGLDLFQNDYALRNLRALANLCETPVPKEKVLAAIERVSASSGLC